MYTKKEKKCRDTRKKTQYKNVLYDMYKAVDRKISVQ